MAKVKILTVDDSLVFSTQPSMGKKNKMKKHHRFQKKKKNTFPRIKKKSRSTFDSIKGYKKSYSDGLYGLLVVMLCILGSTCVTLIPAHNVIENPEFWYEFMLPFIIEGFVHAGMIVVRAQVIFDFDKSKMFRILLDLCCTYTLSISLSFCLIHSVWTQIFAYVEPLPFKCVLLSNICMGIALLRFWFILQKEQQMDPGVRKRQINFIFYILWGIATSMQLIGARKIFDLMPQHIQWVLAVAVPLLKEINDRIFEKFITKAATSETIVLVKILGKLTNNVMFSFWIAVFLVTSATETTGYVLLGINFCLNLRLCYKAIKWNNRISGNILHANRNQLFKNEALAELILNETVEMMAPISFIGSYLLAFYGPNYQILGNVGCSYWTFEATENLNSLLKTVLIMAFMDSGSAVISGFLLWKFCRINIFWEYCKLIKKYWIIMAISGAFNLIKVLFFRLIGLSL